MSILKLFGFFRHSIVEKPFSKVALAEKISVNPLMLRGLGLS